MRFAQIPGLHDEKERLYSAVQNNHVAHAQLFLGNEGSANLAMALAFATLLNCENPSEGDACGKCASCIKSQKFIHPDVHFVFPVSPLDKREALSKSFLPEWRTFLSKNPYGAIEDWSNHFGGENKQLNISKEESRQVIRDLSLKAFEGKYKVTVIWQAEYLHPSAANGLLKILEEPSENTIFILTAHDQEKLLTTILSRTQVFKIRSFDDSEINDYLQHQLNVDEHKARHIAHIASGSLNEAIRLLSEVEEDSHEVFRSWMRLCYSREYDQLVTRADEYNSMSKIMQKGLLQYGMNMMRASLVEVSSVDELKKLQGSEEQDFVEKFSNNVLKDFDKVESLYHEFNSSLYHLERNANPKIVFLDTSLRISQIIRS